MDKMDMYTEVIKYYYVDKSFFFFIKTVKKFTDNHTFKGKNHNFNSKYRYSSVLILNR